MIPAREFGGGVILDATGRGSSGGAGGAPDRGVRAPSLPGEWTGGSGGGGTMKRGASGGGTRPGRQNEREYHEHIR